MRNLSPGGFHLTQRIKVPGGIDMTQQVVEPSSCTSLVSEVTFRISVWPPETSSAPKVGGSTVSSSTPTPTCATKWLMPYSSLLVTSAGLFSIPRSPRQLLSKSMLRLPARKSALSVTENH